MWSCPQLRKLEDLRTLTCWVEEQVPFRSLKRDIFCSCKGMFQENLYNTIAFCKVFLRTSGIHPIRAALASRCRAASGMLSYTLVSLQMLCAFGRNAA